MKKYENKKGQNDEEFSPIFEKIVLKGTVKEK